AVGRAAAGIAFAVGFGNGGGIEAGKTRITAVDGLAGAAVRTLTSRSVMLALEIARQRARHANPELSTLLRERIARRNAQVAKSAAAQATGRPVVAGRRARATGTRVPASSQADVRMHIDAGPRNTGIEP